VPVHDAIGVTDKVVYLVVVLPDLRPYPSTVFNQAAVGRAVKASP